jgi:hypothetical protein
MRHATALELLLTNQVADKGWDVPELEQLRYIARFDLLLTLGLNAHVPVVGGNMSTTSYLCAFKTWSWEAQWVARAALREEHSGSRGQRSKSYHILDPKTQRVRTARDVVFNEG